MWYKVANSRLGVFNAGLRDESARESRYHTEFGNGGISSKGYLSLVMLYAKLFAAKSSFEGERGKGNDAVLEKDL